MRKYFGDFEDRQDMMNKFDVGPEVFPAEDDIVYAEYDHEPYDGYAIVVFVKDGMPFLVSSGHCSCNGLEWEEEETTWTELALRDQGPEFHEIIRKYLPQQGDA